MYAKAVAFAIDKHKNQLRKTGVPYVVHPINVSTSIRDNIEAKNIDNLMAAAVLHDVIEDCGVTHDELLSRFNDEIADIVGELTNSDKIKSMGKTEYLKEKLVKITDDAFIIKLYDRLDNIRDAPTKEYCQATLSILEYVVANRKGLSDAQKSVIADIAELCEKRYNLMSKG